MARIVLIFFFLQSFCRSSERVAGPYSTTQHIDLTEVIQPTLTQRRKPALFKSKTPLSDTTNCDANETAKQICVLYSQFTFAGFKSGKFSFLLFFLKLHLNRVTVNSVRMHLRSTTEKQAQRILLHKILN